ncbi:MAG: hypothetical protein M3O71_19490 [Bacteroidota bacterium]|nr:hypothetical protein [Bacteroidota bacterium]
MEIVYVITHLVMTICLISILYLSLKHNEAINNQEKLSVANRFYTHGLKLIEVITTTGYRIAAGILISYLK